VDYDYPDDYDPNAIKNEDEEYSNEEDGTEDQFKQSMTRE
jgi:hypothetical protein